MKPNLVLIVLTLINAGLLAGSMLQAHAAVAASPSDGVLRGRGLQIVDERGAVRASLQVLPASRQKDGSMSAETVLLRLITENGRPSVKIAASEEKSGLTLVGPTGTSNTYVQALADNATSVVLVRSEDGREQRLGP